MEDFSKLIVSFQSFIPFANSLRGMSAAQWNLPLQPGKWSASGIIGHIMLWDRHFMTDAIEPIASGVPLRLKHSDYDTFNAQAAAYAATVTQEQLIDATVAQRQQLIDLLQSLSITQRETTYLDLDGNPFTIHAYLIDFIDHDRHHRLQIAHFLLN
ncbi:DinB family protein [Paenibacillus rhizovicinus]|uniref:DinB family protein n=1 Tax=Paenibacillus rhizovicinus TaxID=2704463 RepID=A0A6C0NVD7_9BACL|nr:DinB family protein [Paenibacillus rhizovicinus]QHW30081.1 DinB family protein [Paenibacillus rhizovicinus]